MSRLIMSLETGVNFQGLMKFSVCLFSDTLPCKYNSQLYHEGDSFKSQDGCNTCGCSNGAVFCTEMACIGPIV